MKVALCLSGQMRSIAQCWQSLHDHVLAPLRPDVFVHTWSRRGVVDPVKDWKRCLARKQGGRTQRLQSRDGVYHAEVDDHQIDPRLVEQLFEPAGFEIEEACEVELRERFAERVPGPLRCAEPVYTNGMLHNLYTQHRAHRLRQQAPGRYDLVINAIPDLFWIGGLEPGLLAQPEVLWGERATVDPRHQFSSKLSVGGEAPMDVYASLYAEVDDYLTRPVTDTPPEQWPIGERLIFQHLAAHRVPTGAFDPPAVRMHDIRLPADPVWVDAPG